MEQTLHNSTLSEPLRTFMAYAEADRGLADQLKAHLKPLEKRNVIYIQDDISAGMNLSEEVSRRISMAQIILVLLSANFVNSFLYNDLRTALLENKTRIVPILLSSVYLDGTLFIERAMLPRNGQPVTSGDTDQAFAAIAEEIDHVCDGIRTHGTSVDIGLRGTGASSGKSTSGPSSDDIAFPRRNFQFTGRRKFLRDIHRALGAGTPLAISGMGGIGKTQTVIEYGHRYSDEYKVKLWIKADTPANLRTNFLKIAEQLRLPEASGKDPQRIVDAVKNWLSNNSGWLLIFDNADKPEVVRDFLPASNRGHILLTTRAAALEGIAKPLKISTMTDDEGAHLLLLRAGKRRSDRSNLDLAKEIVDAVGGLPLAIEQAGAYIERTQEGLSQYLELYQAHRADLLRENKDRPLDYDYTVATTWSFSFARLEKENRSTAIELIRLCAFLDPDAIPEEIIIRGTQELAPELELIPLDRFAMNEAIGALLAFSLIQRNAATSILTIHRLVQAVIQDDMKEEEQKEWANKAVIIVNHIFPGRIDINDEKVWNLCRRYLPLALACAALIKRYGIASPEAARLLNQAGYCLREQARFKEAGELLYQSLSMYEQIYGPEHLEVARSLDVVAKFYFDQYMYVEAEPLYKRELSIYENVLGLEHQETVKVMNRLALNYWYKGGKSKDDREFDYKEADRLYQCALPISQRLFGPEEARVTLHVRNNQALLYRSLGEYEKAIEINKWVLGVRERVLGLDHLDRAQSLQNLAVTYYEERDVDKYEEAENLLKEALRIREKKLPEIHPQIARCAHYLALVYEVQDKYEEARQSYERTLKIYEKLPKIDPLQIKEIKDEYAALLQKMKRNNETK